MPAWKAENNIYNLPWPTQSQDMNITANIWRLLKIRIKRRVNEIKNEYNLEWVVTEIWVSLPSHYIKSLHQSIQKRIKPVIKA